MARISISDLYLGEGPGEKYGGILNAVMQEVITKVVPEGCDERTWIEPLTVNFLTAMQMAEKGDERKESTADLIWSAVLSGHFCVWVLCGSSA